MRIYKILCEFVPKPLESLLQSGTEMENIHNTACKTREKDNMYIYLHVLLLEQTERFVCSAYFLSAPPAAFSLRPRLKKSTSFLGATPAWTLLKAEHRPGGARTVLQWNQHKHENPDRAVNQQSWLVACSCDSRCFEATHFLQVISIVTWPLHRI